MLTATIGWAQHHPSRPTAFDDELVKALELIELFPDLAPRATGNQYKNSRVKTLLETGHLLVYRRRGNIVKVLAILASRSTPERP